MGKTRTCQSNHDREKRAMSPQIGRFFCIPESLRQTPRYLLGPPPCPAALYIEGLPWISFMGERPGYVQNTLSGQKRDGLGD